MADKHAGGKDVCALIRRYTDSQHWSRHTERLITTTKTRWSGDERSCRANEKKTKRKKRSWPSRKERERDSYRHATTPRPNFSSISLSFSPWYMLKYSTAALSCTAPKTFAHDAGLLSHPPAPFYLSLSLVPLFQHDEKCRALASRGGEGGDRINFGR